MQPGIEELLTLSYNFHLPIGVVVGPRKVSGIVESLDEQSVMIAGEWHPYGDVVGVQ